MSTLIGSMVLMVPAAVNIAALIGLGVCDRSVRSMSVANLCAANILYLTAFAVVGVNGQQSMDWMLTLTDVACAAAVVIIPLQRYARTVLVFTLDVITVYSCVNAANVQCTCI